MPLIADRSANISLTQTRREVHGPLSQQRTCILYTLTIHARKMLNIIRIPSPSRVAGNRKTVRCIRGSMVSGVLGKISRLCPPEWRSVGRQFPVNFVWRLDFMASSRLGGVGDRPLTSLVDSPSSPIAPKRPYGPVLISGFRVRRPAGDVSHKPSSRLSLFSARPAVAFPHSECRRPLVGTNLHCLANRGKCVWSTSGESKD